jgi:hypothetical protein
MESDDDDSSLIDAEDFLGHDRNAEDEDENEGNLPIDPNLGLDNPQLNARSILPPIYAPSSSVKAKRHWKKLMCTSNLEIVIDGVGKSALISAKKEVLSVQHKIKRHVGSMSEEAIIRHFYSNLSPSFSQLIQRMGEGLRKINAVPLALTEELKFLEFLSLCHVYDASPMFLTDKDMRSWFQQPTMTRERFSDIIRALDCNASNVEDKHYWDVPSDSWDAIHFAFGYLSLNLVRCRLLNILQ